MPIFRPGAWLTTAVGCLALMTVILQCVEVANDLVSGVTTTTNKWGPRHTYAMSGDATKYWANVISHILGVIVLGLVAVGCFWLARLEADVTKGTGKSAPTKPTTKVKK